MGRGNGEGQLQNGDGSEGCDRQEHDGKAGRVAEGELKRDVTTVGPSAIDFPRQALRQSWWSCGQSDFIFIRAQ